MLKGASGVHRTNQATNLDYPAFNTIEANYIGNSGVWSKQSAAYYKSVTRANKLVNNVFHDGPRSGVNYNVSTQAIILGSIKRWNNAF